MKKRAWKGLVAALLLSVCPGSRAAAQQQDLATWAVVEVVHDWQRAGLELDALLEWRTKDRLRRTDCAVAYLAVNRQMWPWLSLGVNYEFSYNNMDADGWMACHVYRLRAVLSTRLWQWLDVSLREKYEHSLGQHGFRVVGGHAEEGAEPHPEDGARPARGDGGGSPGDVARAHLRGHGRGQRLEGTHAGVVGAFTVQGNVAEQTTEGVGEPAELNEAQAYGVEDAGTAEQKEKKPSPQYAVDRVHYLTDEFHVTFLRAAGKDPCVFAAPSQGTKKEQIHAICSRENA